MIIILKTIKDVSGTIHWINPFHVVSLRLTGATVKKRQLKPGEKEKPEDATDVVRVTLVQGSIDVDGQNRGLDAMANVGLWLELYNRPNET